MPSNGSKEDERKGHSQFLRETLTLTQDSEMSSVLGDRLLFYGVGPFRR